MNAHQLLAAALWPHSTVGDPGARVFGWMDRLCEDYCGGIWNRTP